MMDAGEMRVHFDNNASNPAITHQEVGPGAHHGYRNIGRTADQKGGKIFLIKRTVQDVRRAAYAKPGMLCQSRGLVIRTTHIR